MKKGIKITAIALASAIGFVLMVVGGYIAYVCVQYYRIPDRHALELSSEAGQKAAIGESYVISTYNIGFGAYSHDFSFFMDSGTMKDGTAVSGVNSVAKDKQTVLDNTHGALNTILSLKENPQVGRMPDFLFFNEVDVAATRSHGVNQFDLLKTKLNGYVSSFAHNFHSAYLFYPVYEPHGKTEAGLATFSSRAIAKAERRSFPIDESFPTRFFDLDRCFAVHYLPIEGSDKFLVLINLHMSAYDEGGKIRAKQLEMLNGVLTEEYEKGNYVVAGGDFNHDIVDSMNLFETQQEVPAWVFQLKDKDLAEHFSFAGAVNCATCRSTDMPYKKGVNYSAVLDGFIVSDNVEVEWNYNVDADFRYSDHNPAVMKFRLKATV